MENKRLFDITDQDAIECAKIALINAEYTIERFGNPDDGCIIINQLEDLLRKQKELVVENLLNRSGYYNLETTAGVYKMLPIDKEKMRECGMSTKFPDDFNILKKYIKSESNEKY